MDPISIASIVASATATCLSTVKRLYDLREKYQDAPVVIVAICSESSIISASLAQIQSLLLQRQDLADAWRSCTDLPMVLDQALTGIMVIFSCLDAEIQRMTTGSSDPGRIQWRLRLRLMWNESHLNDLLGSIRGQQTALILLIQLLQLNSLSDITSMIREKGNTVRASATITQSLRAQNPSVRVANSIYDPADGSAFAHDAASMVAPSELEFEFDDVVINSQAYRRAMAHTQTKSALPNRQESSTLGAVSDGSNHPITARTENSESTRVITDPQLLAPPNWQALPALKTVSDRSNHPIAIQHSRSGGVNGNYYGRHAPPPSAFATLDAFDPQWREHSGKELAPKGITDGLIRDNQDSIVDFLKHEQAAQAAEQNTTSVGGIKDPRLLALALSNGTVKIWDSAAGQCMSTLQGHTGRASSVAWSHDASCFASGSYDRTLKVWDPATGQCVSTLKGHTGWVNSVAWSYDDTQLASGSDDGTVRVWETATGECVAALQGNTGDVKSVAWTRWSYNTTRLASGSEDCTVKIWDPATRQCLSTLKGGSHAEEYKYYLHVNSLAWSYDATRLASGSDGATVKIWDPATGQCILRRVEHDLAVTSVAWSHDARRLASASRDQTVRIWDPTTGQCVLTLTGHTRLVNSVAWSPDATQLASGAYDSTVKIWDLATGRCVSTSATGSVNSLAWALP